MWTERISGTKAFLEYTSDRVAQAPDFVEVGALPAAPLPYTTTTGFFHKTHTADGS